jgi:hypothetical protein
MFNLNLIVVDVIVIDEINFFIHETDESILPVESTILRLTYVYVSMLSS